MAIHIGPPHTVYCSIIMGIRRLIKWKMCYLKYAHKINEQANKSS